MLFVRGLVRWAAVALAVCLLVSVARAENAIIPGSRVAIVGDSITEQKLYSKYMEAYLLACTGMPKLEVFQFGWGGETAGGFANRLENDLGVFKPTVVTLCYGMNDGGYQPYREQIGQGYENNMRAVLKKLEAIGVKTIVVGSPGAVDSDFFRPGQSLGDQPAHVAYNDNLAHLRDINKKLAAEIKQPFADVHAAMYDAMKKAKMSLGKEYDVCGRDGFHPGPNGQLIMAYAFLKAMDLDGKIGEITLDAKGEATASDGHQVISSKAGSAEIESRRWPFCFEGDAKSSGGTRSIVPFVPFNEDLNRFVLKVKNVDAPKAKVTWGAASQEFTKEQLAKGINLAAEFSATPFDASFQKLIAAVGAKQALETVMIKQVITNFRGIPGDLRDEAEVTGALKTLTDRLLAKRQSLEAIVRAQLVPVKHTISVTPVN